MSTTTQSLQKQWTSPAPERCDVCGDQITDTFIDGKTRCGPWACMCPWCHQVEGVGLGIGLGQLYRQQDGGWIKVPPPPRKDIHMEDEAYEAERRALVQEQINRGPADREQLERVYGQVWTTDELTKDFEVIGFAAPFVVVKRKSDGKKGSLEFQHSPRFYYNFVRDY